MSAKKHDSNVVTERRLRPIYDCLDVGNNKKALQEADKLLKKQPDLICAKVKALLLIFKRSLQQTFVAQALRALALIRLSKTDDAAGVLSEIEKQEPDEEYTLQALTYCYRQLGKPHSVISLYERATKKQPQNEDLLSHLMMAYARVGDYKRQNHIAMQLYKLKPSKNPYYFWSVMSNVMQAYDDPKMARTMYLPLAERMIERFIKEGKLNAEVEVKLYILILEMQEKYAEAVAIMQGELGTRFIKCMWEANQKLIELLERLRRWQEVFDMCKTNLLDSNDDWYLWSHFLASGFELIKDDSSRKQSVVQEMTDFILLTIKTSTESAQSCRGPFLARLRIIVCLLERDFVVRAELGEPLGLLLDYFERFGDKQVLFDDVKPYLCLLGEQQQVDFFHQLEQSCDGLPVCSASVSGADIVMATNVKQLRKHLAALQQARCVGMHNRLSLTEKRRLIVEFVQRYLHGLTFGRDLLPTELQYADGYLLLAVYTLWDTYLETSDMQLILEVITLLTQGLQRSAYNFRFKSLMIKFYSLIGCGASVMRLCEAMDTKYILRDTLWYLICDQLSPWGLYQHLIEWTDASLTFYAQSEKEIVDCVAQCYKSGSFPKIIEFFDFRKRLSSSFHNLACRIWQKYFSIILDGSNLKCITEVFRNLDSDNLLGKEQWLSMSNNSDYSIFTTWNSDEIENSTAQRRQELHRQLTDQLRFYQLVVGLLALLGRDAQAEGDKASTAATAAEPVQESATESTPMEERFEALLSELRAHCKQYSESYTQSTPVLNGPGACYYELYLAGSYANVLFEAFTVIVNVDKAMKSNQTSDQPCDVHFPAAEETQHMIRNMFSAHQLNNSGVGFPFLQLCHVSFLVQTISLVLVAVSIIMRRAQSHQQTTKEKKVKKKKTAAAALDTSQTALNSLLNQATEYASMFCRAAETTLRLIDDLEAILETNLSLFMLNDSDLSLPEFCDSRTSVAATIKSNYQLSIKELTRVLSQHLAAASSWYQCQDVKCSA